MDKINIRFAHYPSHAPILLELQVSKQTTMKELHVKIREQMTCDEHCLMRVFGRCFMEMHAGSKKRLVSIADSDKSLPIVELGLDHESVVYLEGPLIYDAEGYGMAIALLSEQVQDKTSDLNEQMKKLQDELAEGRKVTQQILEEIQALRAQHSNFFKKSNSAIELLVSKGVGIQAINMHCTMRTEILKWADDGFDDRPMLSVAFLEALLLTGAGTKTTVSEILCNIRLIVPPQEPMPQAFVSLYRDMAARLGQLAAPHLPLVAALWYLVPATHQLPPSIDSLEVCKALLPLVEKDISWGPFTEAVRSNVKSMPQFALALCGLQGCFDDHTYNRFQSQCFPQWPALQSKTVLVALENPTNMMLSHTVMFTQRSVSPQLLTLAGIQKRGIYVKSSVPNGAHQS